MMASEAIGYLNLEDNWGNRLMYVAYVKGRKIDWNDFGQYMLSKILWILLAFLPFLALFLKLLYINKRDHFYIDHLAFATHQIVTFIIIITITNIEPLIWKEEIMDILYLAYFIHLYIAMYRMYGDGKVVTFLKMIFLSMSFGFLAVIFLLLSGFITFLIY